MRAKHWFVAFSVAGLAFAGTGCDGDDAGGASSLTTSAASGPVTGGVSGPPTTAASRPTTSEGHDPCATTAVAAREATASTTSARPGCGGEPAIATTTVAGDGPLSGAGVVEYALEQPIPQAGGVQYQYASLTMSLVAVGGNVSSTIEAPPARS